MLPLLERIIETLPTGWIPSSLYLGLNWTLAITQNQQGERQAGLAATPAPGRVAGQSLFQYGSNLVESTSTLTLAQRACSSDPVEAAVGLATLNAFLRPDPNRLTQVDAADWLVTHGQGRKVALIGRFPFIDELKPVVAQLWVLELSPQPGEYDPAAAPQLVPQADVVAITSSTLINQTLDGLLALARPEAKVMLLGPSTPLTPVLFEFGVDLLSGVQVVDIEAALVSVAAAGNFQKMKGVRRVTMEKDTRPLTIDR
ncbi:MAG TPA: DUF364 domain-containing protein [Anaerolineae bacterium]|nr:DUF364 domain-containing protein [Anaerolineae bacterium]